MAAGDPLRALPAVGAPLGIGPIALMLLGGILVGCTSLQPPAPGGPYPGACPQFGFTERRCAAVVTRAIEQVGVDRSEVAGIDLLPIPSQAPHFGQGIIAVVGLRLGSGAVRQVEIGCPGISAAFDPACGDEATISRSFGSGVDRDIPCDPPPDGCAELPPEPPADVVAKATPFRLAAIDIPIDHPGSYEIKLGTATLPNGFLSERSLRFVNDQPTDFWIAGGRLLVRPDLPDRPPVGSAYREPYDGLEPVTILLEFEVTRYVQPGVFQLRDIVVR